MKEEIFYLIIGTVLCAGGLYALWISDERVTENIALRHQLRQVCDYIDSLPKKHRAVFEACQNQKEGKP
ncbi:hypothetical protein [Hydrogenobacter thermophilus]|uniref:hypothetical protein n=1 Tax=Hydrogenobacter thermophilus TaxID=940 RepID=UPI0030FD0E0E